jgi:hypothetical protein
MTSLNTSEVSQRDENPAATLALPAGGGGVAEPDDLLKRYQGRNQTPLDAKKLLIDLKALRKQPRSARISIPEMQVVSLCATVKELLAKEQTMVRVSGPVIICGDIHGQFHDLMRLFDAGGWPPDKSYMFLGDYVDRGSHSLETIMLLFVLKALYVAIVLFASTSSASCFWHARAVISSTHG